MNASELIAAMRAGAISEDVDDLKEYVVDQLADAAVILEMTLDKVLKAMDDDNERDLL